MDGKAPVGVLPFGLVNLLLIRTSVLVHLILAIFTAS